MKRADGHKHFTLRGRHVVVLGHGPQTLSATSVSLVMKQLEQAGATLSFEGKLSDRRYDVVVAADIELGGVGHVPQQRDQAEQQGVRWQQDGVLADRVRRLRGKDEAAS